MYVGQQFTIIFILEMHDQLLIYDVVRRYFEYKGYEVIYVSNFTDVDDKLINRSKELNESVPEIAEKYIKAFMRTLVL